MKRGYLFSALVLSGMLACNPTVEVTDAGVPRPSTREPVVANEQQIFTTIRFWVEEFQSEQHRYYEETGHYAEDVTVDGEVTPLGSSYDTHYWVSESLKGYEVTVTHKQTGRACRLSEGRFAHPDDVGQIRCNA